MPPLPEPVPPVEATEPPVATVAPPEEPTTPPDDELPPVELVVPPDADVAPPDADVAPPDEDVAPPVDETEPPLPPLLLESGAEVQAAVMVTSVRAKVADVKRMVFMPSAPAVRGGTTVAFIRFTCQQEVVRFRGLQRYRGLP